MNFREPIKWTEYNNDSTGLSTEPSVSIMPSINQHFHWSPFPKYLKSEVKTYQVLFSHKTQRRGWSHSFLLNALPLLRIQIHLSLRYFFQPHIILIIAFSVWNKTFMNTGKNFKQDSIVNLKIRVRTSLVAQWLGVRLPMQGTQVRSLVQEDPTCRRATKPMNHNYWSPLA